ncbi:MAG TPA: ABC transporter permease [Candidatus Acidoferrum sp.]|nr:ABC transporter permease [Candidatus Acidoferrum sp.]
MRNSLSDLRLGVRNLLRNPGFACAAIVVLALGIGANTAIFSIVNGVLLRPLPFQDASRIMQIWHIPPAKSFPGLTLFAVSPANYLDWQSQNHSFEEMAAVGGASFNVTGNGEPESIQGAAVASGFYSILGVQPVLGRGFTAEDDGPGAGHVIILSDPLWRTHFGADPAIVGRNINLDGQAYTVVGVMSPRFRYPSWAKFWVPLAWTSQQRAIRGNHNYMVIGRLKAGVQVAQAKADLSAISSRLEQLYPEDDKGWGATVRPLREDMVGDVRPALLVLLGAVAFVLLIACANVANLVLAKTLARKKEMAIRASLGATRFDTLRHILAETLLLAFIGGTLGLFLAQFATTFIVKFFGEQFPRSLEIKLDSQVLLFTILLSLLAGVLAGLLPSLRFSTTDLNEALKQGQGRGGSDSSGTTTRSLLVIAEVALSLVLLIGAGLMVRSLFLLSRVAPGFDPDNVLTMSIPVPRTKFPTPAEQISFFERILQQVRTTPGVESAGAIDNLPLDNGGSHQPISIEGQPVLPMADQPEVDVRCISAGYFRALHIPLLRGRDTTESDVQGSTPVVLISESLAERFWPHQDPIGRHLTLTFFPGVAREVVGIVGDVKLDSLDETRPVATVYWPLDQITPPPSEAWRSFGMNLAVRTLSNPVNSVSSVTAAVHQVDPESPVADVATMSDLISQSVSPQRFNMLLLAFFAGLALLLAAVGIYSVLSYNVRRRFREIGIRIALGATRANVLKLVVADGLKPILIGVAIGLAAALALGRLVAALLYGVRPTDPFTFVVVALLLVIVGVLATVVPAYRATRVEPVRILREE